MPQSPGIYIFKDKNNQIIYIGKSKNLKNRVSSYFKTPLKLGPKTSILVNQIKDISFIKVESEIEALLLEASLIKKHQPKYNIDLKDGKSYPYIKITKKEEFPRVILSRQMLKDGSLYFGPFPDSGKVRFILRWLRKIIPYCSCKNHPKSCLYYHLGLCPHPSYETDKIGYQKNIRKIIDFLSGRKSKIIKDLNKEMNQYSKTLDFEKAAKVKKQIETIEFITSQRVLSQEYIENPNLIEDKRNEELFDLQKVLNLRVKPEIIECYDISNTSGKEATGSLVTFLNGEPEKSKYKKFKIKTINTPDDYAMLKEVFVRRFNNNWPLPDLFVVDGGKGQFEILQNILNKRNLKIPVIGLAKRFEEIYSQKDGKLQVTSLSLSLPSIKLLQRLRDEAHRFAKFYHIKLRKNKFLGNI